MDFHYPSDVTPGPMMTRPADALRESQKRVNKVILMFRRGVYETVEEAVASTCLMTPSGRDDVRKAITPE
jgi:hypothetical protein